MTCFFGYKWVYANEVLWVEFLSWFLGRSNTWSDHRSAQPSSWPLRWALRSKISWTRDFKDIPGWPTCVRTRTNECRLRINKAALEQAPSHTSFYILLPFVSCWAMTFYNKLISNPGVFLSFVTPSNKWSKWSDRDHWNAVCSSMIRIHLAKICDVWIEGSYVGQRPLICGITFYL